MAPVRVDRVSLPNTLARKIDEPMQTAIFVLGISEDYMTKVFSKIIKRLGI